MTRSLESLFATVLALPSSSVSGCTAGRAFRLAFVATRLFFSFLTSALASAGCCGVSATSALAGSGDDATVGATGGALAGGVVDAMAGAGGVVGGKAAA